MHAGKASGLHRCLGAADMKTIIALVFALAGLSWAAISFFGGREDPEPTGPRVIASAVDDDGNAVEADYRSTNSASKLEAASQQIENIVSAESMAVLSSLQGPKGAPEGVSESVVKSFIPLVQGDHDAFLEAIIALGGVVPGDLDGEHRLFTHLKKQFAGAKIDLSRISVRKYEPMQGGAQMTRQEDEEDGGGGPGLQTNRMEIRPQSIFPDAPDYNDPSAIEVRIPVMPKGEDLESVFSLVLTWNRDAKLWQPATYGIIKNRLVEQED